MKLLRFASLLVGVMLAFNLAAQTARTVTVKVQDASGQPVAGATVEFSCPISGWIYNLEEPKSENTDSDGVAKLSVIGSRCQIFVHKTGLAVAGKLLNLAANGDTVVVTLGESLAISGVVVDESDKPVPDAEVSAVSICFVEGRNQYAFIGFGAWEEFGTLKKYLSARTGADGQFRIQGFPADCGANLAVKKKGKALSLRPRSYYIATQNMTGRAGDRDLKLQVLPAASIAGKVVVPGESNIMSQVSLQLLNDPGKTVRTGPDGSFRFEDLAADKYSIRTTFGTNVVADWVARNETVTVEGGQVLQDVKITAVKGGILEVATFSAVGHTPLGNVVLSARSRDFRANGKTEDNGVGLLRLVPGSYQVFANQDGTQSERVFVKVEEGKTNRVELELTPPPQLSGTVRDTNGAPAVGVLVSIYPTWTAADSAATKTDNNGHYRIRLRSNINQNSPPFLMVRDRERNLAAAQDIDQGKEVYDLQIAPALVISGRVQDEQSKPLTNAEVILVTWGGGAGSWIETNKLLDAQGRYEISFLPTDRRYSVKVSAKGHGSTNSKPENLDTNRFEFETITLRVADKQIAGRVVDLENKPVTGASVSIYGEGQPSSYAVTDAKGRFTVDEVCDGTIDITVSTISNAYGSARADAGDTNIVVTLREQMEMTPSQFRASMVAKPLPDLIETGIPTIQTNKPLLICLFDPEQRPSRRALKLLGEQNDALKQKGITVLGISAALMTADALKEWKQSNPMPFSVGGVTEKTDQTKWILGIEKFPWLILTDAQCRVKAEGFDLDDLEAKLK